MDNKKWYRRFGTIFWWTLTILPFVVALIYFIGYHLTFNSGITSSTDLAEYHYNSNGDFIKYLAYILINGSSVFNYLSFPFIVSMFTNLFRTLSIPNVPLMSALFGWMVSVQFYHMIFDFIVWLPRWFHSIMEKGFDKL